MTGKEKLIEFLNKKLKDAKEKLEEISKEIAFINAAVRAIKEKETVEPNLFDGIEKDFSYHLCPDQYVGKIRHKDNWQKFYKRTDIFKDQTSETKITITEDKILLLILESPHTDEFDKNGEPIGPANGPTGRNIREYIAEIFPNFSDYHLILMNAIPFQCSLGVATEHFRDNVFKAAWDDDKVGAGFFEDRLKKLLYKLQKNSKNVVVVNACTGAKGNSREPLCCKVCQSIVSVLENYSDEKDDKEYPVKFYHIHHPSTWNQINRTRNEKFGETDCVAVNPNFDDKSDEIEFNCKESKYWEKYLDTENLACSCFGKLEY